MVLKGKECNLDELNGKIDDLVHLARVQDAEKIKKRLQEIVPEYKPAQSENSDGAGKA
jgi:TolA-binding protein